MIELAFPPPPFVSLVYLVAKPSLLFTYPHLALDPRLRVALLSYSLFLPTFYQTASRFSPPFTF